MPIKLIFPKNLKIKIPDQESDKDRIKILEELPLDKSMATPLKGPSFELSTPKTTADRLFGF